MVHDRGTIKWTSLMLPEHVALLEDMWRSDKKVKKPILDEQETEQINHDLMNAYTHKEEISISVYSNGTIKKHTGYITKVLTTQGSIVLKINEDRVVTILFKDIVGANG